MRRLIALAILLALPARVFSDQGGPVYMAVPTYPTAGGACTAPRVQIEAKSGGKMWVCVGGVWEQLGGGGGTPGGTNEQVQFNANGSFGADSNFRWDNTLKGLYSPNLMAYNIYSTPDSGSWPTNSVPDAFRYYLGCRYFQGYGYQCGLAAQATTGLNELALFGANNVRIVPASLWSGNSQFLFTGNGALTCGPDCGNGMTLNVGTGGGGMSYGGYVLTNGTQTAHKFWNSQPLVTAGDKIAGFYSDGAVTERAYISYTGLGWFAGGLTSTGTFTLTGDHNQYGAMTLKAADYNNPVIRAATWGACGGGAGCYWWRLGTSGNQVYISSEDTAMFYTSAGTNYLGAGGWGVGTAKWQIGTDGSFSPYSGALGSIVANYITPVHNLALLTCGSATLGSIMVQGGSAGTYSYDCQCQYDGTTYLWRNLATNATGNTTTCPSGTTIPSSAGGTGLSTAAIDTVLLANPADTWTAAALPSCSNATTSKLLYDTTSHAFSCGTDQTGGGGGAPTTATYWTATAEAGLSAEVNLGGLTTGMLKHTVAAGVSTPATATSGTDYAPGTSGNATGLVISTTGTGALTAYSGTSCTNQFNRSLSASGVATCAGVGVNDFTANQGTTAQVLHGNAAGQPSWGAVALGSDVSGSLPLANLTDDATSGLCLLSGGAGGDPAWTTCPAGSLRLDQVTNPNIDKTFTMGNNQLKFTYTAPTPADGAFEIEATGGFTGDVLHVHQHTGNPGAGTDLIHAEFSDTDVTGIRITAPTNGTAMSISSSGRLYFGATGYLTTAGSYIDVNGIPLHVVGNIIGDANVYAATAHTVTSGSVTLAGNAADSGSAVSAIVNNASNALVTAGAKLLSVRNWGTEKFAVDKDGVVSTASPIPSSAGGTGNAYFAVSGPATATKTFTFPNASATVLTSNAAVTVGQGGTGLTTIAADQTFIATATDTLAAKSIPNCAAPNVLHYSTSSHAYSCDALPMDISAFYPGKPGNSQTMMRIRFASAVRLPASLTGSQFYIATNPTSTLVLDIRKRLSGSTSSSVGSLSISTGGVFTVTFSSQTDFAVGDHLEVINAASADATAADFSLTFLGTRIP